MPELFTNLELDLVSLVDKDLGLRPWQVRKLSFKIFQDLPTIGVPQVISDLVVNITDDDLFESVFAFRTKKDKSIRRTRARDVLELFNTIDLKSKLLLYLAYLEKFDYISVVNILRAAYLFRDNFWFETLAHRGAFASPDDFLSVTKDVSNMIKISARVLEFRMFIECYNLVGYRNPPFGDFNLLEESVILAGSGNLTHDVGDVTFKKTVKDVFPLLARPPTPLSFRDFIYSGVWTTSGSSSMGRAVIKDVDNNEYKIKCRKNLAMDVLDLDELIQQCLGIKRQDNTALLKSELGKMRLAVAGDLKPYLLMSYLNYYLNAVYLDWPGNTLEESNLQTLQRQEKMSLLTSKGYQLPFDFSNFDHQPTLDELSVILAHLCEQAKLNTSELNKYDVHLVCDVVLESFKNSHLLVKDGGVTSDLPVTGGLMSGMRWTSLIGNMWNTVISTMVGEIVSTVVDSPLLARFIRGDDSALFCKDFKSAYLFKKTYDFLKVKSVSGKFAIMRGYMEFLRIQFTPEGCFSYPMRSIPSYLQSKPWTASPWNPFSSFDTITDVMDTMLRRGITLTDHRRQLDISYNIMLTKMKLPSILLSIPKELGGIGVRPWDGQEYIPNLNKLQVPLTLARMMSPTTWREVRWDTICKDYGLTADPINVKDQCDSERFSIMLGDEIPEVKKMLRVKMNARISGFDFTPVAMSYKHTYPGIVPINLTKVSQISSAAEVELLIGLSRGTLFGSFPALDTIWKEVTIVAKLTNTHAMDILKGRHVEMYNAIKDRRLKHLHRATTIDFLAGNLPSVRSTINPAANFVCKAVSGAYLSHSMVDNHVTLDRKTFLTLNSSVQAAVASSFAASPVYLKYYNL